MFALNDDINVFIRYKNNNICFIHGIMKVPYLT